MMSTYRELRDWLLSTGVRARWPVTMGLSLVMIPLLMVLFVVAPFAALTKPLRDRRKARRAQKFQDECLELGWQCRGSIAGYTVEGKTGDFAWTCEFYPNPQDSTSAVVKFDGPFELNGWIFLQPRSRWNSWSSSTIRSSGSRPSLSRAPGWLGAYPRAAEVPVGAGPFEDRFVVAADAASDKDRGLAARLFTPPYLKDMLLALDPSLAGSVTLRCGAEGIWIEHPMRYAYQVSVLRQLTAIGAAVAAVMRSIS
jgi:hypothetical protein